MQQPDYKSVILGFIFSLHSRRFVLALITMFVTYQGGKAGLSTEVLAMIVGTASAFILGESGADAARANAAKTVPDTVTAGGDVSVSTPEPSPEFPTSIHQPQPVTPEPSLVVEDLFPHSDSNLLGRRADEPASPIAQDVPRPVVRDE